MIIKRYKADILSPIAERIGRTGENIYARLEFDVTSWRAEYPSGTVSVLFKRPDGELYPVIVASADNPVVWTPNSTDLSVVGEGKLELRIMDGDVIGKSTIMKTLTEASLGEGGETPPAPEPNWVDEVIVAAGETKTARDAAVTHAENALAYAGAAETARAAAVAAQQAAEAARSSVAGSATAAANSAAAAAQSEQAAQGAKVDTLAAKGAAEGARDTAVTKAEEALASANVAAASQTAAGKSAIAAAESAAQAAASASEAAAAVSAHAAKIATAAELGHVKPIPATPEMTSPVGVDAGGKLWTAGRYFERSIYGLKWDKVNAQCARAFDADGITTTTTDFTHNGSVNPSYSNPFDSIYPWSGRRLCNISLAAYLALPAGAGIVNCVTAWEGAPGFGYADPDGVWVYTPEYWYRAWNEGAYRYIAVSETELPGWVYSPARIRGRWFGVQESRVIGGVSKIIILPHIGQPVAGLSMTNMHLYANNAGMTIENIYSLDAEVALYLVEFANYNAQAKLGSGVSDLYRQGGCLIKAAATNSSVIQIGVTDAGVFVIPGATIDIGTSDGGTQVGRFMVVSAVVNGSDGTLLDVTLDAPVTVTTAHFWSIHGKINIEDGAIGSKSGYIGTNGKSEAYYRGGVIHANRYRYILGAYRQQNTGHIWVTPNEAAADAVNALDTGIHIDTGLVLPQAANGAEYGGYIKTLGEHSGLAAAPFCVEGGGSSENPVGDYTFTPALVTANTVLRLGGSARYGAHAGPWFGDWYAAASFGGWYVSAVPLLKTP